MNNSWVTSYGMGYNLLVSFFPPDLRLISNSFLVTEFPWLWFYALGYNLSLSFFNYKIIPNLAEVSPFWFVCKSLNISPFCSNCCHDISIRSFSYKIKTGNVKHTWTHAGDTTLTQSVVTVSATVVPLTACTDMDTYFDDFLPKR